VLDARNSRKERKHETRLRVLGARPQGEYERLQKRLHATYVDKLDGRVDKSFYAQMSEQWQLEQDKLMQEIIRHQAAERYTSRKAFAC
jgi:site-specific DNA recombinase